MVLSCLSSRIVTKAAFATENNDHYTRWSFPGCLMTWRPCSLLRRLQRFWQRRKTGPRCMIWRLWETIRYVFWVETASWAVLSKFSNMLCKYSPLWCSCWLGFIPDISPVGMMLLSNSIMGSQNSTTSYWRDDRWFPQYLRWLHQTELSACVLFSSGSSLDICALALCNILRHSVTE